jgi:hypothetical protein
LEGNLILLNKILVKVPFTSDVRIIPTLVKPEAGTTKPAGPDVPLLSPAKIKLVEQFPRKQIIAEGRNVAIGYPS